MQQKQQGEAPRWEVVAGSEQFQSAPADVRETVRQRFYEQYVAPSVPQGMEQDVWTRFAERTSVDVLGAAPAPTEPVEQDEPTAGEQAGGLALGALKGAMRSVKWAPDLVQMVAPNPVTQAASDFFQQGIEAADQLTPEAYREQQQRPIIFKDEQGNLDWQLPSLGQTAGVITESLPQIPSMLVAGGGAARGLQGLGLAKGAAQAVGYGAANSAMVTPLQHDEVLREALAEGRRQGLTGEALEQYANERANALAQIVGPLSFATGAAGLGLAARLGEGSGSALAGFAKGVAADTPFEAIEEGGQHVAADVAMRRPVDTTGALNAGAMGALAGGVTGGALGAISSGPVVGAPDVDTTQPSQNTRGGRELGALLDEEVDNADPGGDPESLAIQALDPENAQLHQDGQPAASAASSGLDLAANAAATSPNNDLPEPTQAQKEAGNYKKGRIRVHGMDISIENPRGSERSGTGPDGAEWRRTMSDHYGYIKRTTGADGEQVDVYVGPQPDSDQVFVVDQLDQQSGSFDEHKAMVGYPDQESAIAAYRANFDEGWQVGPVTAMPVDQFKAWLKEGDLSGPLAQKQPEAPTAQPAAPNIAGAAPEVTGPAPNTAGQAPLGTSSVDEPLSGESEPVVPPRSPPVVPPTVGHQLKAPPANWRRNYIQARQYAKALGVPLGKGQKLAEMVTAIEARIGVQDSQPFAQTEQTAPEQSPVEIARELVTGNHSRADYVGRIFAEYASDRTTDAQRAELLGELGIAGTPPQQSLRQAIGKYWIRRSRERGEKKAGAKAQAKVAERGLQVDATIAAGLRASAKMDAQRAEAQPVPPASGRVQTQTENFKRWFGDSKVVDADGKPLVVYHGTNADFSAFDPERSGKANGLMFARGIYLTANPEYAGAMAQGDGSNLMPVYVSLQTPAVFDSYAEANKIGSAEWKRIESDGVHDGVIIMDQGTMSEVISFRPDQVKSAIGNSGEFDPANPDIRYRLEGEEGGRLQAGAVVEALAAAPELAGIQVVQSFDDLPLSVRTRAERDGVAPDDMRGVFRPDGQYLVADNLESLDDAVHTAVHEMVGHLGVRGVLGRELDATLERIYSSEAASATGRQRIAQIREVYAEPLKRRSLTGQRLFVAEEIVAHLAESGDRPTVLQRFVSKVRAVLRKLFPQVRWTYNDILALIDQSRAWLRRQDGKGAAVDDQHYALVAPAAAVAAPPSQGRLSTDATQESAGVELPVETLARRGQRLWQDKLNRFTVLKEWLAERGVNLSEQADVYKAEERMHSRFANKAKDFRESTVRPMVEKIQKAGFDMADVAQYLHAQHAQERNAQIARINKQMPDGGSGMSNAEARAILAAADPQLVRLANELRAITDRTRKVLLDSGLIGKEQADAWQKAYQHYVPLKGGPDGKAQTGTGKGLSASHKSKRALGHKVREEGEWIVENIIADHERALMAAEKNLVGRHLLKMAMDVGMDEIMTVGKPEKRGVLQNRTSYEVLYQGRSIGAFDTLEGARTFKVAAPLTMKKATLSDFTIRQSNDPSVVYMASPMPAPNEALVYVDGQVIRIQINDDLLARAYNNLGTDALGTFMSVGRALNRWFSIAYTGYNPEFLVKNVIRDFTTGLANITGEEGALFAAKTAKNYFTSFGALLRYARKGTADQWIRQYREDGGNTGAAYLSDLERLGADVQAEYAAYQGVLANLRKGSLKGAARAAGRRAFNATLRHIEALNEAGENAMRLALYRTAIEQGMSRNKAASMAKNTTVNFNRRGELGAQANALYLFFNASVQGTASLAHAHFKGQHKRQAWALSGAMAALGYSLALLAAGADEDEHEKTPDHAKARNLVIPLGDGQSLTIPIPYGYGFFFNVGRQVADAQRTGETDGVAWKLAASFAGEFTPFSGAVAGEEPELAQAGIFLMPTMGQIPLSIAFNRTSFGGPMRPDNSFKAFEPDRLKMWRGTEGTWADSLAGALEGVGMDVSPETLKYLNRTFTGGAGNFVGSTVDAAALGAQGAVPEAREVPFLRGFYRENGVADARARFWRYQAKAKKAAEELERAIDAGDRSRVQSLVGDNRELIAMAEVAKAFSEASGAVRDRVQEIRLGDLPVAEQREQIRRIEQRETELYDRFIGIFKARVQAQ